MKPTNSKVDHGSSHTTEVLLAELREECEQVISLIRRLEIRRISEQERDEILGELSAAVLHLHTHSWTR